MGRKPKNHNKANISDNFLKPLPPFSDFPPASNPVVTDDIEISDDVKIVYHKLREQGISKATAILIAQESVRSRKRF